MANVALATEDLSDIAAWTPTNSVVTVNTYPPPVFAGVNAGLADAVADVSAAAQGNIVGTWVDIAADTSDWVGSVYVRKDAVVDRWPDISMSMNSSGLVCSLSLNTSTGAVGVPNGANTPVAYGVIDVDAYWWRVWMRLANNGLGTAIRMAVFPSHLDAGDNGFTGSAFTGSVVLWGFNITQGSTLQAYEPNPVYTRPTNILLYTEQFGGWTNFNGFGVLTSGTYAPPSFAARGAYNADTLADSDTGNQCNWYQTPAKGTNDSTSWTFSVHVRKDAITTRFPAFLCTFEQGGTDKVRGVRLNTSTGAIAAHPSWGGPASSGVIDVDANWWRVWMTETDNASGNTKAGFAIYPAQCSTLSGGDDSTTVGSVVVWGANITHDATVQPYTPSPAWSTLGTNLTAYWSLEEASGIRTDSKGASHLSDFNSTGVSGATGKVGSCCDFESASLQYLRAAGNADLLLSSDQAFTFSAWVRAESFVGSMVVLSKDMAADPDRSYQLQWSFSDSRARWLLWGSDGTLVDVSRPSPAMVDSTWYHLICGHDPVANQVFIIVNNGTPDVVSFSLGTRDNNAWDFRIGAVSTGSIGSFTWDGLIDEVGFWKRVLTPAEITYLYNSGNGRSISEIDPFRVSELRRRDNAFTF